MTHTLANETQSLTFEFGLAMYLEACAEKYNEPVRGSYYLVGAMHHDFLKKANVVVNRGYHTDWVTRRVNDAWRAL